LRHHSGALSFRPDNAIAAPVAAAVRVTRGGGQGSLRARFPPARAPRLQA
jgi:hypothetical protein